MIYADISEFVSNPIGTGIQRTIRAIFRHWPDGLAACYLDKQRECLRTLAPDALAAVLDESGATVAEKAHHAAKAIAAAPGDVVGDDAYVLIPELFWDHVRCTFYAKRVARHPTRTLAIVYDLFPWLFPRNFGIVDRSPFEPYFRLVFSIPYTAHISLETKQAYETAGGFRRPWELPILHLGADGLAIEKQAFQPDRKAFVCFGSIEKRKRQADILHAFESLWAEGLDAELVFVGKLVDHGNASLGPEIEAAKRKHPQFTHYPSASDEQLTSLLSTARATIMVSTLEGYGIPPVESLYAGIPVIVSNVMPSTNRLPVSGQIRVDPCRPDQIASAVRRMLNDDVAHDLWNGAATIQLPTWRDVARQVKEWATQIERVHSVVEQDLQGRTFDIMKVMDLETDPVLEAERQRWMSGIAT